MNKFIALAVLATAVAANAKDSTSKNPDLCNGANVVADENVDVAVVLKGTMNDITRVVNLDGTGCEEWAEAKGKVDVFVGLCYLEINCTDCNNTGKINDAQSFVWLVDKKYQWEEFIAFDNNDDYQDTNMDDYQLICTAYANRKKDNAIAMELNITSGLWYSPWNAGTSTKIVLTGTRDCTYGIKQLDGYAVFNSYEDQADCDGYNEDAQIGFSKVSLRRDDSMTKSLYSEDNKYCYDCSGQACDDLEGTVFGYLDKKYFSKSKEGYTSSEYYIPSVVD